MGPSRALFNSITAAVAIGLSRQFIDKDFLLSFSRETDGSLSPPQKVVFTNWTVYMCAETQKKEKP